MDIEVRQIQIQIFMLSYFLLLLNVTKFQYSRCLMTEQTMETTPQNGSTLAKVGIK
jgi:hypothetical protein